MWLRRKQSEQISLEDLIGRETEFNSCLPSPYEEYESKLLCDAIFQAINSLSKKHRQVITLHYLNGMSYEEIAERLDISESTVRGRLWRF
jgi:RNA polymerase sigma-70 factor (ECF subfamily)